METTAETEPKKLRRSTSDRLVAGVCGGLGEYFGFSPTIYRIAFVALSLVGGTGLVIYLAAALVIPAEGSDESIAAEALRGRRDRPWLVVGVALVALGILVWVSGAHNGRFLHGGGGFWIALGALIVWGQQRARARQAAAGETPRGRWRLVTAGGILAGGGALALLDLTSTVDVRWWVVLSVGGILLAILAFDAIGLGLVGLALALVVGAAAVAVMAGFSLNGGVGDRTVRPAAVGDLKRYELGIGHLSVDVHDLSLPAGETRLRARVGFGQLDLYVPTGVSVRVDGKVTIGDADVLGRHDGGTDIHEQFTDPGAAATASRLVIDAKVGIGELSVHRGEP